MKYPLQLGSVVWLVCSASLFAQSNPSSTEQKQEPSATSTSQKQQSSPPSAPKSGFRNYNLSPGSVIQQAELGAAVDLGARNRGTVDILSDTMGVDFGPYLKGILQSVRENWHRLIPESAEMKKGKLAIEFAITRDGKVASMRLASSAGDAALDRAAWGSIIRSNPFPSLPEEFTGPYLALRFRFYYNPDKGDLDASSTNETSKSRTTVIISPRRVELAANSEQKFSAMVTGTANRTVTWSVIGLDCSGSADGCGTVSPSGVYTAPRQVHSSVFVKVRAVSKAASAAYDSVTVRVSAPATAPGEPSPLP